MFKQGDQVDGIYLVIEGEFTCFKSINSDKSLLSSKTCPFILKDELPFSKVWENEIIGLLDIFWNKPFREITVKWNSPNSYVYFIKKKEVARCLRDERTVNKIKALMIQQKEFFESRIDKLQDHYNTIQNIHLIWSEEMQKEHHEYK